MASKHEKILSFNTPQPKNVEHGKKKTKMKACSKDNFQARMNECFNLQANEYN